MDPRDASAIGGALERAFQDWCLAGTERRRAAGLAHLTNARRLIRAGTRPHLAWLSAALGEHDRKSFVAWLFAHHPVPKALFVPMLHACLRDVDASSVQIFVRPLVETFGSARVVRALEQIVESGSAADAKFARMSLYWARPRPEKRRAVVPR